MNTTNRMKRKMRDVQGGQWVLSFRVFAIGVLIYRAGIGKSTDESDAHHTTGHEEGLSRMSDINGTDR